MADRSAPHAEKRLREWLEYVAETAIELLDAMDARSADLEDDEIEDAA